MQQPLNKRLPYFDLVCVKSDYPHHLVPGLTYRLRTDDKDDEGNVFCYFYFHEKKFGCVGLFPLSCFNVDPIRKWIAEIKIFKQEQEAGNGGFTRSRTVG